MAATAQAAHPTASPAAPEQPSLQPFEQAVSWRTWDEGTLVLAENTPVRRVRRQFLEQVRFFDEENQEVIEVTVPRERVLLVPMEVY